MSGASEDRVRRLRAAGLHDGGFAHVSVMAPGLTIFTAGISPLDAKGELVGPGDALAQTRRCLEGLAEVLTEAGAGPETVAKLTVYVATDSSDVLGQVWRIVDDWFALTPASIVLGVAVLPYPGQVVEVEAVAAARL